MKVYVLLLALVMAVSELQQSVNAGWSRKHRKLILKIHNDYRKGTTDACDMKMMRYDKKLEKEAKAWAKRCVFEHQMKGRGENLVWQTKIGRETDLVKSMAKMWYDEVKDYTYGEDCGAACHYTQMVWSKSTKLGCYAEHCDPLIYGGRNAYYLVCFYSPAGNMVGYNPYQIDCDSTDNGQSKTKKTKKTRKTKKTNKGNGDTTDSSDNSGGNNNNGNNGDGSNSNEPWVGATSDSGWVFEGTEDGWKVWKRTGTSADGSTWTMWRRTYSGSYSN